MRKALSTLPKVYAYVRLSREDMKGAEATDAKLADRASLCRRLAADHALLLPEENIVLEVASGTALQTRAELKRLLSLARSGELTHLITPYQDRLTRGSDADRGEIKDALLAGRVTLITTERVMRFDDDFGKNHELTFDISAVVASNFVRDVMQKRKEADHIRLLGGRRVVIVAPYGYRRISKQDVLNGRFPSELLNIYQTVPEEYAVLLEIFRRLKSEKASAIIADLNRRNVPPPGATRPGNGGRMWHVTAIYNIIRNPFYIGYLAQKTVTERGRGRRRLEQSERVWAEVKGEWDTPITEDEFAVFQSQIESVHHTVQARKGLLTGIAFCPQGMPYRVGASRPIIIYTCLCAHQGRKHPGNNVSGDRLEAWVKGSITAFVESLPDTALPTPPSAKTNRQSLLRELAECRRAVAALETNLEEMMLKETYLASMFGREQYEKTVRKHLTERDTEKARLSLLEEQASVPDTHEALTLLQQLKQLGGMERFWETATDTEQRSLIERIVQRIDIEPPPNRYVKSGTITFWDWVQEYNPPTVPFPKVKGGPDNLIRPHELRALQAARKVQKERGGESL